MILWRFFRLVLASGASKEQRPVTFAGVVSLGPYKLVGLVPVELTRNFSFFAGFIVPE